MNYWTEKLIQMVLGVVCIWYILWVTDTLHMMMGWPY